MSRHLQFALQKEMKCYDGFDQLSTSSSSSSPSIRADPCSAAVPSWMHERKMQQQYQYNRIMGHSTFSRRRRRLDLCARIYLNVGGLCRRHRRRCIHQSDDERC